jgi:holo-[acyl-carrier protein] synthase
MIVGLGLDVAEVDRIEEAIARHGAAFLERVFTPAEQTYCERFKNRYERYAARFAAKEAAMKALGTGWSRGVRWRDIEVVRERGSRPTLHLSGVARQIADSLGVKHIAMTITHSGNMAMAQVVFES